MRVNRFDTHSWRQAEGGHGQQYQRLSRPVHCSPASLWRSRCVHGSTPSSPSSARLPRSVPSSSSTLKARLRLSAMHTSTHPKTQATIEEVSHTGLQLVLQVVDNKRQHACNCTGDCSEEGCCSLYSGACQAQLLQSMPWPCSRFRTCGQRPSCLPWAPGLAAAALLEWQVLLAALGKDHLLGNLSL